MEFKSAANPQFGDVDHSFVNLLVVFLAGPVPVALKEGEEPVRDTRTEVQLPYSATPSDPTPLGRELYGRAIAGEFGAIAAYVPPPPVVPRVISRFQGRAALYQAGRLEEVQDYMDRPDTPMLHKMAWIDAQQFERDSDTVAVLAQVLVLTSAQVDQLFIAANGIKA